MILKGIFPSLQNISISIWEQTLSFFLLSMLTSIAIGSCILYAIRLYKKKNHNNTISWEKNHRYAPWNTSSSIQSLIAKLFKEQDTYKQLDHFIHTLPQLNSKEKKQLHTLMYTDQNIQQNNYTILKNKLLTLTRP